MSNKRDTWRPPLSIFAEVSQPCSDYFMFTVEFLRKSTMATCRIQEAKELICELCQVLYVQEHVSGTGGGISIKVGDKIVMAPSGVQKERMRPEDMFILDAQGNVLETPAPKPPPHKPPKLSECAPLFMSAYELRNAGAVIHGHSINAFLATLLDPEASEFRVTHIEMIKGIEGHGFYSNCVVPIIENTARECELTDRLRDAMRAYPEANAVLVRRHGVYVWGRDWIHAKTQAECYEYLFEAAVKMRVLGLDASRPPAPPTLHPKAAHHALENGNGSLEPSAKKARLAGGLQPVQAQAGHGPLPTAIVLDIEGTVASISYVTDVLFPYARQRLASHLEATYDSAETQEDLKLLRHQAEEDSQAGRNVVQIPPAGAPQEEVIAAAVANCEAQMAEERKTTALKSLQGHIWRQGFLGGELKADLFRDVPDALAQWRGLGIKTYIYSSGSREAQKNLFGHTTVGDLRPYLSGFFDTTSGSKVEAAAYKNIALSLGVDSPSDVLFATDNLLEAQAAAEAGWRAVLVERPGNKALPGDCGFAVVRSMTELLQHY